MTDYQQKNRILILSYKYSSLELSPTIKSLASYLLDQNYYVLFISHQFQVNKTFTINNLDILQLKVEIPLLLKKNNNIFYKIARRSFLYFYKYFNRFLIKKYSRNFDYIFCVEFESLNLLKQSNIMLNNVIYLSMESIDLLKIYPKAYVTQLLSECKLLLIQSAERKIDFENHLNQSFNWDYLPVSIRPVQNKLKLKRESNQLRILNSGYFANWSCLKEVVQAVKKSKFKSDILLYMQGHSVQTENYYNSIIELTKGDPTFIIDSSYYSDKEYIGFLKDFDIGLALYGNFTESVNWENLLFSSGKIASYLWAGLPVLTNINSQLACSPPFIQIESISTHNIDQALQLYSENKELYNNEALIFAHKYYNADKYLSVIMNRIYSAS